ncbi:M23 family metallopeptidase [Desulfothermus okinawensis JCM 13304]
MLGVLFVILIGLGIGYYVFTLDRIPPKITLEDRKYIGINDNELRVSVKDNKSFLKQVDIEIFQGNREKKIPLELGKDSYYIDYKLDPKKLGFNDGKITIVVRAVDKSINNFLRGNVSKVERTYILDTSPPTILMKTYRHYLQVGGSGVAGFSVSEPVAKAGVEVYNYFFPAYKFGKDYLVFFAIPYDVPQKDLTVWVVAKDLAGNIKKIPLPCYIRKSKFKHSRINISDKFLNTKMVQFQDRFKGLSPLEIFLKVNNEVRKENREKLKEIGLDTEKKILFKGAFLRMPNAARMASFGDKRTYFYKGKKIDQQTHLGIDLASVSRAKVIAANFGRVVYAGWYGIYGNAVIIDHGYGVQSLYGHLSLIKVKKGDFVKKGQVIGLSGATGLAGGDHLHFGMLISGIPVNPVEWWDPKWMKNNIFYNLKQIRGGN